MASRLESLARPMEILLSEEMLALIEREFRVEERGVEKIKGVGRKRVFLLEGEEKTARRPRGPAVTAPERSASGA
jgi:class 3 adenylate cyclase